MPRRILATSLLGLSSVGPCWSACAVERDTSVDPMNGSSVGAEAGSGGSAVTSGSDAGKAGSSGASAGSVATSGGGGVAGSAGSATAAGGEPEPGAGGELGVGGAGGAAPGCRRGPDCDDGDPCTTDSCVFEHCSHTASTAPCEDDNDPCTDDVCSMGACTHPDNEICECQTAADCNDNEVCTTDTCEDNQCVNANNTAPCPDDGSACTDDVCAAGQCTHPDNDSCECLSPADCDDSDPCTFNQCTPAGDCAYPDNGTCMVGTPFVVDSFNSATNWLNNVTTPALRALVKAGFDNTNLEGGANVYLAASAASSLEIGLASMVGLGKLRIVIRCAQADTATMVHLGTWNGTAWSEKALSAYAPIPTASYATIEVPLVDFGQNLAQITKMRLRFAPTGGQKEWRIDEISAAL